MRGGVEHAVFFRDYPMKYEADLRQILSEHPDIGRDLRAVRSLGLPDWYIAAGYVRNYVWDHLSRRAVGMPLNDVDVIYFDLADESEISEKRYEHTLANTIPAYNWSVKNQARMHDRNRDRKYESVYDAMKRWPETATAIGITLDNEDELQIIAPHGLTDLFKMKVRQSPYFADRALFQTRVQQKMWLETWPGLELIE